MYSMWKIMFFFNIELVIALHQIHKIMFFLTKPYDLFNNRHTNMQLVNSENW